MIHQRQKSSFVDRAIIVAKVKLSNDNCCRRMECADNKIRNEGMSWSRLSEQNLRVDKWSLCRGYADSSLISRIENGIRDPSLLDAFALQVVFGDSPNELFPALFKDTEEAVLRRVKELYEELQDVPSKAALKKLELLDEISERAISRLPPQT
ncbi:hypothetical protein ABIC09_007360 [Bradyrhizobium sp. S3.12.5]|uniref:hypothetical protein n=1 Tax=Bradyrhizobium sp. S3.12.5 TaxID=3156386 RepID=UPI003394E038